MLNINFVPDDYTKSNESRRINLIYIVLLSLLMATLGTSFITIKMRQHSFNAKEKIVNEKMARAEEALKQFEELQIKRKSMMRTALTTADLLEPVPRSVLLASLINNLPMSVSFLELNLIQKEPKTAAIAVPTNKYNAQAGSQQSAVDVAQAEVSLEKSLETLIDIEGIAPSDLQVATYIEHLSTSDLLDNVALVESKELKIEDTAYRQFKLTAMLKKDVHLSKEDINRVRVGYEKSLGDL